jgi:hypothetical protein
MTPEKVLVPVVVRVDVPATPLTILPPNVETLVIPTRD